MLPHTFILEVTGQTPAPQPPPPTCPSTQAPVWDDNYNKWTCATTWQNLSFAQKFQADALLFAFIAVFLVLSIGVAIFGTPIG